MKIHAFLLLITVVTSCQQKEQVSFYGEKISSEAALSTADFVSKMENTDSAMLKMEAKIIETCQKKGCWMTLDLGDGEEMRVTFKDYGFFVPKEGVEGKSVVIDGYAKKSITDVETLRHYAKDAGKSETEIAAITNPKKELTYVAVGAAIRDYQE